jgi:hypothetical protein
MKPPADTDVCVACDHTWAEHCDDATEAWKTDCEHCRSGEFVDGRDYIVDDLTPEQMAAYIKARRSK